MSQLSIIPDKLLFLPKYFRYFRMRVFLLLLLLLPAILGQNDTEMFVNETLPILPPKVRAVEIIQKLFNSDYDRRIRPSNRVNGKNMPVEVDVNAYIRSMSNIDFVKMEYTVQLTFRQSWVDNRLAYAHMGERVAKFLIINRNDILWIPDTFFQNEKQAYKHTVDVPNVLFRITPDGRVLYSERVSLILSCPMYLQSFPMDRQKCELKLASYAFTTDDIIYRWAKEKPLQFHVSLNTSLPNFVITQTEVGNCSSITTTGEYSCLSATFHMARQFSYYLIQIYGPSTLLVIVSWVSFWLDRTAVPARVTLGVTTLLTITTQTTSLNASLPAVSYVKAVDIWMGGCLVFIFGAVFEYAYVSLVASNLEISQKKCKNSTCEEKEELLSTSEKKNPRTDNGAFGWWHHWTYQADESKMIDLYSRILFPLAFVIFNIFYWSWYAGL